MDAKLMMIVLGAALLACLFQQTRADCLSAASEKLNLDEVPKFAKDIVEALRKLNPSLTNLPLIDMMKSPQMDERGLAGFFTEKQQNEGAEQCGDFVVKVDSLLKESGCDYGALDLEVVLAVNDFVSKSDKITDIVAYIDACIKI